MQTISDFEWKSRIESVGLNYPITINNFCITVQELTIKFQLNEIREDKKNIMDKINQINIILTELFINNDFKNFSEDFKINLNFYFFIKYFKVVYEKTLHFIENEPELKSTFVLYDNFNNNRKLFEKLGVELIGEISNKKRKFNSL